MIVNRVVVIYVSREIQTTSQAELDILVKYIAPMGLEYQTRKRTSLLFYVANLAFSIYKSLYSGAAIRFDLICLLFAVQCPRWGQGNLPTNPESDKPRLQWTGSPGFSVNIQ